MSMPSGGWQTDSGLLDVTEDVVTYTERSVLIDYFVFFGVIAIFFLFFYISTRDK